MNHIHTIPVNGTAAKVVFKPYDNGDVRPKDTPCLKMEQAKGSLAAIDAELAQHMKLYREKQLYIRRIDILDNKERTVLLQTLAKLHDEKIEHLRVARKDAEQAFFEEKRKRGLMVKSKDKIKYRDNIIKILTEHMDEQSIRLIEMQAIEMMRGNITGLSK